MSVKKNFLYNVAYQILVLILPLVTAPYLSRVLGAEGLGVYSYTYSIAYYFVLFGMLGVNNYGNRAIAMTLGGKGDTRETFWGIWSLQAFTSIITLLIYIAYALLFSGDALTALIWVPYVLTSLLDINWLFFGLERFKVTVTRNFIVKLITFALTLVVVRGDNALFNYLVLMSLSLMVSVLVLWPFVLKEFKPIWVGLKNVLKHVKPNLVLFVPVIAISLYNVLDKIMLGQISGMYASGIFENSLKVAQMPYTLITALGTVMLPHASQLVAAGKHEESIGYMAPSMWFAMLLSSAFTFGLVAVSPEFCPVFFGDEFDECIIVMTVIVFELPFLAWANVIRTQWLIPTMKDRAYVASVIIGAIANVAVNLCLIPSLGALGAGIGTLVAEIVVCVVQTIAVSKELPLKQWFLEAVPGLVIGALMLVIVRLSTLVLPMSALGLLIEILVGMVSFTVLSLVWYLPTKNPYVQMLLSSIKNRLPMKRKTI